MGDIFLPLLGERQNQDKHRTNKIDGGRVRLVPRWWSRGESNPCPKATWKELLRAQFVIYIPFAQREQTPSGHQ